jgi:hypothetical protein
MPNELRRGGGMIDAGREEGLTGTDPAFCASVDLASLRTAAGNGPMDV